MLLHHGQLKSGLSVRHLQKEQERVEAKQQQVQSEQAAAVAKTLPAPKTEYEEQVTRFQGCCCC